MAGYEESREKRMKENLEQMQKLGIGNVVQLEKPRRYGSNKTPPVPSRPLRRSSRVLNSTAISYSEEHKYVDDDAIMMRKLGSKPEVYTDEHDKLLGRTDRSWTLFVDGYGRDGRRIIDLASGKLCHHCRIKTIGHCTNCFKCNKGQGQICGDCLYVRYREHVLEANHNPEWICPACRGICNCSVCRRAKGWPPTGNIYSKISSLGYKSVAHYLIKTRRSSVDEVTLKEDDVSKTDVVSTDGDSKDAEDAKTPDTIAGNAKKKNGNQKINAKDASVISGMDSIARRLKMRHRA